MAEMLKTTGEGGLVDQIRHAQRSEIEELGGHLGLTVVTINPESNGTDASEPYIQRISHHGHLIGATVEVVRTVGIEAAAEHIDDHSSNPDTHGIMVQLPDGERNNAEELLTKIPAGKDVDGLTPAGRELFRPPTPAAILSIIDFFGVDVREVPDDELLVVGDGRLVGGPLLDILRGESFGKDPRVVNIDNSDQLVSWMAEASLAVTAVGKPDLVTVDMMQGPVTIIDAGVAFKNGERVGDVHPDIYDFDMRGLRVTPPTGGVGPVATTELFENTIQAARQ